MSAEQKTQFIKDKLSSLLDIVFGDHEYQIDIKTSSDNIQVVIDCKDEQVLKHMIGKFGKNIRALRVVFNIVCKSEGIFAELFVRPNNKY